jgi:peptidoglycan/LPS O-acetylase OafA/YrhL
MVLELLAAVFFTWGLLLFSLRRKVTSRVLAFYGGLTLELYLAHGFFVNLFHEPFYDKGMGIVNVGVSALYILLVLACATPLASLWHRARRAQKAAK